MQKVLAYNKVRKKVVDRQNYFNVQQNANFHNSNPRHNAMSENNITLLCSVKYLIG